jgi:hypothetical protein
VIDLGANLIVIQGPHLIATKDIVLDFCVRAIIIAMGVRTPEVKIAEHVHCGP